MRVRAYNPTKDYTTMCEWWEGRHPVASKDELPSTGFFAEDDDGTPVAALFLILTNAKFAYFETAATNPKVSWELRDQGMLDIIHHASEIAKSLGFRRIMCVPFKQGLVDKAFRAGFVILNERPYLCVKEL